MLLSFSILLMHQDVCFSSRHQVLASIKSAGTALVIFNSKSGSLSGNCKTRHNVLQALKLHI